MRWLNQDLAAKTIDDRPQHIRRNFPREQSRFTQHHERLRLLEDWDKDGHFEISKVLADGFNDPLDGIAAGHGD
jgi:quinoprotein glucose dehydrogenase